MQDPQADITSHAAPAKRRQVRLRPPASRGASAECTPWPRRRSTRGRAQEAGDALDAFPREPLEFRDTDGDGTGDNADGLPDDPSESADTGGDGADGSLAPLALLLLALAVGRLRRSRRRAS